MNKQGAVAPPAVATTAGTLPTATSQPTRLRRLARFGASLYLLSAIVYTAYHLVVVPAASHIAGAQLQSDPGNAPGSLVNQVVQAGLASANPSRAATAAVVSGEPTKKTTSKNRHAALETAGVRAADIRNEDSSDPVWAAAESADRKKKNKAAAGGIAAYTPPEHLVDGRELVRTRVHGFDGVDWDADQVVWHHPATELAHSGPRAHGETLKLYGNNPRALKTTSEDELLSISFGSSLQPSKVIPYYYRATEPDRDDFNKEDITITTLVTSNRFTVFERLVERYQGGYYSPNGGSVRSRLILCPLYRASLCDRSP